ncbi:Vitellogenin [Pseudolycoriella hygida]|uniref:Vitellogenin n=1 Tax=Pseudolycoriella hygida TaxID=35572 RepID=A0A9Q0RXN4_9DIPT|nr:Vitellogenin [Pseudolycoriella hygida]
MKSATLLTLILIGCVAGDGAWKENTVYTYRLSAKTYKHLSQSNTDLIGVISRAYLSIRPQSADLLIGQITQAEYGKVTHKIAEETNWDNEKLENYRLEKPFAIHMDNGVIRSLSVDNSTSNYEINQLKVIVSQLQVDTNAQNHIGFSDNQLPRKDRDNAFYKTMEPLVTGNCETVYDISPIPDYVIQSHPELAPLPELKGADQFIQIAKSRTYDNCHETSGYLLDIAGRKDSSAVKMGQNRFHLNEKRRIVISGTLENYTIQSSVTTNEVRDDNSTILSDYVNVTLQSVEPSSNYSQFTLENMKNMKNIGNLVYNYDSYPTTPPTTVTPESKQFVTSNVSGPTEHSTSCWTAFPTASTLCKSEFGPEFADIKTHSCGFLELGKQALCRLSCE